jgi:acyl-CoA dehydrogenase family member 9
MEAVTAECASFIDRGFEDFMLETAMLKVWSTDVLWQIVNDTMQIYGGAAFFMDKPYERWMRDARLNTVGEGANDVLRAFIAMVGIKPVADQFLKVKDALSHPLRDVKTLLSFGGNQIWSRIHAPEVPVRSVQLREAARRLGGRVRDFSQAVQKALMTHREQILFRQYVQERIADAACELYASSCALARLDQLMTLGNGRPAETNREVIAGRYFLRLSDRRFRHNMAALSDNDDALTTQTADAILGRPSS